MPRPRLACRVRLGLAAALTDAESACRSSSAAASFSGSDALSWTSARRCRTFRARFAVADAGAGVLPSAGTALLPPFFLPSFFCVKVHYLASVSNRNALQVSTEPSHPSDEPMRQLHMCQVSQMSCVTKPTFDINAEVSTFDATLFSLYAAFFLVKMGSSWLS